MKILQFNFFQLNFSLASYFLFCLFNNHLFCSTCTGDLHAFFFFSKTIIFYVSRITLLQFFYSCILYSIFLQLPLINHIHTRIFPSTTRALTALFLCYETGTLLFFTMLILLDALHHTLLQPASLACKVYYTSHVCTHICCSFSAFSHEL